MTTTLAVTNAHVRDARIRFEENGHVYYIDDVDYKQAGGISCTAFVKRNKRWSTDPTYKYYRKSRSEIEQMWRTNGAEAREAGTAMHADIESFYNGVKPDNGSAEYKQFLAFHATTRIPGFILEPYRTEWFIYDEEHRLTGAVDMVYREADGTFSIYDWKRSKEIKKTGSDYGLWPLTEVKNCNHAHYALQLSVYASILTRCYGMTIKDLVLIVCHPDQSSFTKVALDYMEDAVRDILDYRKLQLYKSGHVSLPADVEEQIGKPENGSPVWKLIRDYN